MRNPVLCILVIGLAGCVSPIRTPDVAPYPESGESHPFFNELDGVITGRDAPAADPGPAPASDIVATDLRAHSATVRLGAESLTVELKATPEVPPAALSYLAANLRATTVDLRKRKDLEPFLKGRGELLRGQPEVRLPSLEDGQGNPIYLTWPDGWDLVRPHVIRLRAAYATGAPVAEDAEDDVGVATAALVGNWTSVTGTLTCQAPDDPTPRPLGFVRVEVAGSTGTADAGGVFNVSGSFTEVDRLDVVYQGAVTSSVGGVTVTSPMSVMNDFHNPRRETVDVTSGSTTAGVLDVGTLALSSLDCELFELGTLALTEYEGFLGAAPPSADGLRIKRWEGIDVGTPHSFYDYVAIANNFRPDFPARVFRLNTVFHEFGHTVRHAADGDLGHWNWDNFRWAYARNHNGTEVFNEQYAFNEGWAQYWECTAPGRALPCPGLAGAPGANFLDWNELQIGRRLFNLAAAPGVGHAAMVRLLLANPGSIHTLWDFEVRYCALFGAANPFCNATGPARTKASCPPGFVDDGATCRQPNILAKPSYGRGVGVVPTGCGARESDAGLCYDPCPAGFDGVGPVCWRDCPAGMHDDGAFCRRDVDIISSDNSACPWFDVCGLTFAAGCSTCPPGYQNDGCTCRIDAWIFAKQTQPRGVGTIPTGCSGGRVYDAGLCYTPCAAGFTGVGPVCWGPCPPGFDDHGATCYRPPNILVKF